MRPASRAGVTSKLAAPSRLDRVVGRALDAECLQPGFHAADAGARGAARLGYRCALTAEPGLNRLAADRFALRRVPVGGRIDLAAFERLMLEV